MARNVVIVLLLAAVSSTFADFVFDLDANTFENYVREKDVMLIDFYAPWCGHCQKLAPQLENAAGQLASKNQYVFAKVDCTLPVNQDLCKKFNVQGYPSLKLFKYGTYQGDYIGERDSSKIVQYMDSVAEMAKQAEPLSMSANAPFAPQPMQQQPQAFAPQPYPQPNLNSYFQHPGMPSPASNPMQSYFNGANPAAAAAFASQHPAAQAHAPPQALHLGASPDSLAGKFGGNMLALEILRSKLKMIAAYKNWQRRLKEYKDKMTEAAQMNPYNRAKLGSTKHTIHKPPIHPVKPKAFYKRPRKYQTKKYPRTGFPHQTPYGYNPYQKAHYQQVNRRSSVYTRAQWAKMTAAAAVEYRQKLAEFQRAQMAQYRKFYIPHPAPVPQQQQVYQSYQQQYQRSHIARPKATASYRPQPATIQPHPQASFIQPQPQASVVQPQAQASVVQPQTQASFLQPQTQASVVQPQTQPLADQPQPQPQPQAQPQPSVAQAQYQTPVEQPQAQASIVQPKPQVPAVEQEDKVTKPTNDAPAKSADQSINDLKHDIENAIQDALNNKGDNSETKPAVKAQPKPISKALDVSGSGSGEINTANTAEGHVADNSGSGSGSGEVVVKSHDKSAGES